MKEQKVGLIYIVILEKIKERTIDNKIDKRELSYVFSYMKLTKNYYNLILQELINLRFLKKWQHGQYKLDVARTDKLLKMLETPSKLYHYIGCW